MLKCKEILTCILKIVSVLGQSRNILIEMTKMFYNGTNIPYRSGNMSYIICNELRDLVFIMLAAYKCLHIHL